MPRRLIMPLDPDCPDVETYMSELYEDPMTTYSGVGDELADAWEKIHRNRCQRCREYGAANVVVG